MLAFERMTANMNFIVCARPADRTVLDQHILSCSNQPQSLRERDTIHDFQTSLMPFLNERLGQTMHLCSRSTFPRRVLENKRPVELHFFDE